MEMVMPCCPIIIPFHQSIIIMTKSLHGKSSVCGALCRIRPVHNERSRWMPFALNWCSNYNIKLRHYQDYLARSSSYKQQQEIHNQPDTSVNDGCEPRDNDSDSYLFVDLEIVHELE
jgi:hypothetical protein